VIEGDVTNWFTSFTCEIFGDEGLFIGACKKLCKRRKALETSKDKADGDSILSRTKRVILEKRKLFDMNIISNGKERGAFAEAEMLKLKLACDLYANIFKSHATRCSTFKKGNLRIIFSRMGILFSLIIVQNLF
jgi:hypothetical protein